MIKHELRVSLKTFCLSVVIVIFRHIFNRVGINPLKPNVFYTYLPIDNVRCENVRCSTFLTLEIFHHQVLANFP